MDVKKYDLVIIGAGAAGLTAALFASRRNIKTLVVSKDIGGQAASTTIVNNYPGIDSIDGGELMRRFHEQAKKSGAEFLFSEVKYIERDGDEFFVNTFHGRVHTRAIILAFGLSPRELGVPGEELFKGKSIVHDYSNHDDLFLGKEAAIVGAGNSAFTGAIHIASLAKKVWFIHRTDKFRAEPALIQRVEKLPNIEFLFFAQVKELRGDGVLKEIIIEQNGKSRSLSAEVLYLAIGFQPRVDWMRGFDLFNSKNEIITDNSGDTGIPGLFACGDITNVGWKQIVISSGEGCKAALSSAEYLAKKDGRNFKLTDWS